MNEQVANPEGEGVVLALALFYPNQYAGLIAEIFEPDDFHLAVHRDTFDVLRFHVNEGRPINPHTIWATIRASPGKSAIKELGKLMELRHGMPREHSESLVRDLLGQLRPLGVKRRIARMIMSVGSQAEDNWSLAHDVVSELEVEVDYIAKLMAGLGHERKGFFHVKELIEKFDKRLVEFHMGRTDAIATGLDELDMILNLGGLNRKGMYVIAATPGVGKTSLALSMMQYWGMILKIASGFTTLEMDKLALMQRLYSIYTSIPYWMFRPNMYGKEYDAARAKLKDFAELPYYLMDSVFTMAEARRYYRQLVFGPAKAQVITTDYLQLMGGAKGKGRYDTVTELSRDCKIVASELNIPHVIVSQLNRDSPRENRPPEMYDLRESGQIEADAEAIFALWERPEEREGNRARKYKYVELIILKQRNGPTCLPDGSNIQLVYLKDYMHYLTLKQFRQMEARANGEPEVEELFTRVGPISTNGDYEDDF